MKIAAAVVGVLIVACLVVIATTDPASSSTAVVDLWLFILIAIFGIAALWIGVLLFWLIRWSVRRRRFANRNQPS
jgi:hypothetical protein